MNRKASTLSHFVKTAEKPGGVPIHVNANYVLTFNFFYHISSVIRQRYSLPNNPRNLGPFYKMDLDLWDCFGKEKAISYQIFRKLMNILGVILERE